MKGYGNLADEMAFTVQKNKWILPRLCKFYV